MRILACTFLCGLCFRAFALQPVDINEYLRLYTAAPGNSVEEKFEHLIAAGVCLKTADYRLLTGSNGKVADTPITRTRLLCGYRTSVEPDPVGSTPPPVGRDAVSGQFSGPEYNITVWLWQEGSRSVANVTVENRLPPTSSRPLLIAPQPPKLILDGKTTLPMTEDDAVRPFARSKTAKNTLLRELPLALFQAPPTKTTTDQVDGDIEVRTPDGLQRGTVHGTVTHTEVDQDEVARRENQRLARLARVNDAIEMRRIEIRQRSLVMMVLAGGQSITRQVFFDRKTHGQPSEFDFCIDGNWTTIKLP